MDFYVNPAQVIGVGSTASILCGQLSNVELINKSGFTEVAVKHYKRNIYLLSQHDLQV